MDREIVFINNILNESNTGLTTGEISKKLFEYYNIKVSKKIVQNYLWSYFRNIISYDSNNYTYTLDSNNYLLDDSIVITGQSLPRAIEYKFIGNKIQITYDKSIPTEKFIKSFVLLNFRITKKTKEADLVKLINRLVEEISIHEG